MLKRLVFTLSVVGLACCLPGGPAQAQWRAPLPEDVRSVLEEAKRSSKTIPAQADRLARLAWPLGGPDDPRVASAARQELVDFGRHAIHALRAALRRVDPIYTGDVTATLIEARYQERGSLPSDFLPALEEAIWFGSVEARRLAIKEFARRRSYPLAVLSTIDAIFDHPELTLLGLRSLGAMSDPRARFFLTDVLRSGSEAEREVAALGLASLGPSALDTLRREARSEEQGVREAAVGGLLPVSGLDDLPILLEYYGLRSDDDPGLRERVLERASLLEEQLEALHQDPPEAGDDGSR